MKRPCAWAGALAIAVGTVVASPVAADEVADFYQGKQVTVLVPFDVGGGNDIYARALARYIGKHIPGQPTIIVRNMPGGGGLLATNYMYNVAPQDGTTLISMLSTTTVEPILGNKNARWDAAKINWLGNLTRDYLSCMASGRSGITSIADAAKRQIVFGGTGPGAGSSQHPYALINILGINGKVISAYKGTSEVWIAMDRGEVDAVCAFWASLAVGAQKQSMDTGRFVPIVQMGSKPHPAFGNAPMVYDLARNEEDRTALKFIFAPNEVSRPFATTPGVPAARLAALRKAFWETATSAEFRDEAGRLGLFLEPMTAQETEDAMREFITLPPEIVERAKIAIRPPEATP